MRFLGLTYRLSGLDGHIPSYARSAIGIGHEARVLTTLHSFARLGKSGLCGRVVLLHELKLNNVANIGGNGLGVVSKDGRHTSRDRLQTSDYYLIKIS